MSTVSFYTHIRTTLSQKKNVVRAFLPELYFRSTKNRRTQEAKTLKTTPNSSRRPKCQNLKKCFSATSSCICFLSHQNRRKQQTKMLETAPNLSHTNYARKLRKTRTNILMCESADVAKMFLR